MSVTDTVPIELIAALERGQLAWDVVRISPERQRAKIAVALDPASARQAAPR